MERFIMLHERDNKKIIYDIYLGSSLFVFLNNSHTFVRAL